ncbi:hypothetical protein [Rhodopirellula halodulae]|uniref:hypothetical protein n=1 Tax=Rhodopirellula halodulae TaxID=2894198 RepID=UPI001E2FD769|nr:hypothetical protein [Rhodopirellula sp. JC737]MCC9654315.1 hypothetical protein [Rhodopirellula sp. JC737]
MLRLILVVCCSLWLVESAHSERPNVLLFYIDDLRPQTSDYGHEFMNTPNFDRLAAEGVRFENA